MELESDHVLSVSSLAVLFREEPAGARQGDSGFSEHRAAFSQAH